MGSGVVDSVMGSAAASEHLRLANILDQMPVGIGVFDQFGRLFHSNRHFEHAAGGLIPSIDSITSEHWEALLPDGSTLDEQYYPGHRALNGQVATPGVDFLRTGIDGEQRWVGMSAVPLTISDSHEVVGAVVVVEDIEDRRRAEEQLRAQEARFKRFAEFSSNALWLVNVKTGEIEYLSQVALAFWGADNAPRSLDEWAKSLHPEDRARAIRSRKRVASGEAQRFDYRLVDNDGVVIRHVRETSFLIPGTNRDDDCLGGIVEDLSPQVQIYLVQHPIQNNPALIDEVRLTARRIKIFSSADDLLNVADVLNPGCVIVDMHGSGESAEFVPEVLGQKPDDLQIIFVGPSDTPPQRVIDAMRAGARDYVLAPLGTGALARAIHAATEALPSRLRADGSEHDNLSERLSRLPRREREVLLGLVSGGTNKSIARDLGISPRTVEVHRAHLMDRMNVRSLTELLQLAHMAGLRHDASRSDPGSQRA